MTRTALIIAALAVSAPALADEAKMQHNGGFISSAGAGCSTLKLTRMSSTFLDEIHKKARNKKGEISDEWAQGVALFYDIAKKDGREHACMKALVTFPVMFDVYIGGKPLMSGEAFVKLLQK